MTRLLIVGAGDIARRTLPALATRYEVLALVRGDPAPLTRRDVRVIVGDLDRSDSLASLQDGADIVLHLAPPTDSGERDERTRHLVAALSSARMLPRRVVYISTSGVYGDCNGACVDESRPLKPQTDRARRRVDAEHVLSTWTGAHGIELVLLRVPGIYAADRLPLERLRLGTPVLRSADDVYTNHIHADDLASVCVAALEPAAPAGVYNAADDTEMKMGDYFDLVADRAGLARPPRVPRSEAEGMIPPMLLSFMSESRRLVNRRMKAELGVRLRYPTVYDGVPIQARGAHNVLLSHGEGLG